MLTFALALVFVVSGSAIAGAPGSGDDQLAAAAKKCKKGFKKVKGKCKKKPSAAPVAPVAAAPVAPAPAVPPPADEQFFPTVDDVLFDITALSGTFDATVTRAVSPDCTLTKDAHWTTTLVPGPAPAVLSNIYTDSQGPVYIFDDGNPGGIPVTVTGSGVATLTCPAGGPPPDGTASCTFNRTDPMDATVSSNPEGSRDPINLEWFFGYNVFYYANPINGGTCMSTGTTTLSSIEDSPGLFVSPLNDGTNALEPIGMSTAPLSQFSGNPTLNFTGSTSGAELNASWQLSVSLDRQ